MIQSCIQLTHPIFHTSHLFITLYQGSVTLYQGSITLYQGSITLYQEYITVHHCLALNAYWCLWFSAHVLLNKHFVLRKQYNYVNIPVFIEELTWPRVLDLGLDLAVTQGHLHAPQGSWANCFRLMRSEGFLKSGITGPEVNTCGLRHGVCLGGSLSPIL